MQFLATNRLVLLSALRCATVRCRRSGISLLIWLALPGMVLSWAGTRTAFGQTPTQPTTDATAAPTPAAEPTQAPAAGQVPAPGQTPATAQAPEPAPVAEEGSKPNSGGSEVTEEELRKQLVGKPLFLRGAYLGDSLSFTEHGDPTGHPAKGSFTLSGVEIERVRLTKHKVELEGARYGLHYVDGLSEGDASKEVDRIRITQKKKVLRITIDREQVARTKPVKEKGGKGKKGAAKAAGPAELAGKAELAEQTGTVEPAEKESDQAADPKSVTTTSRPAHAATMLQGAIDKVLAQEIDAKLQEQMPTFWRLYFQAKAAGMEYRPHDPNVLRSNAVDQQAKVVSAIAPDSNEFAQAKGISGRALYRTVIGADGLPAEIAVVRPIGFGLDEKAVEAIQKAKFQPAMKAGQPVAETLDLSVMFRIFSKRTGVVSGEPKSAEAAPVKPGPFTVKAAQEQQPQPQPQAQPQ
jgi:TonB family protein